MLTRDNDKEDMVYIYTMEYFSHKEMKYYCLVHIMDEPRIYRMREGSQTETKTTMVLEFICGI